MDNIKKNIPIFIISYNRLQVLKQSINSYLKIIPYKDIIIIDNGSDLKELIDYLNEIKLLGVTVYYNSKLNDVSDLNTISKYIEIENTKRNNDYYIVTDPDICLNNISEDILDIYSNLFNKFPEIEIVGPMLTIIDIPEDFPAREYAWKKHVEQFWHKKPLEIEIKGKNVFYQFAAIDTTFGMIRKGTPFRRLLKGIRTYNPYEALHLDWYITSSNITDDQTYYLNSVKNDDIAHWSGSFYEKVPQGYLKNKMRNIYIIDNDKMKMITLPKRKKVSRIKLYKDKLISLLK